MRTLSTLLILGAVAATRLFATIESIKITPTFVPSFSPVLLGRGITEGKLALVISVSPEGKLTDWLVLGYTDPEMVRLGIDALKDWDITPARVDGQPVAAQVELILTITAKGAVVSVTGMGMIDNLLRQITGNPIKYRQSTRQQLDRLPVRLSTLSPEYADEAEKQGVRGRVRVHFYIDEDGVVRMPSVEAGAHPYLADAAVTAVREWKFEPPTSRGRPVLVAASQVFDFGSAK
jgi:TonB family protein